ncbi:M50 family metallopeptidase [Algicola sagamiensis]|uniref:M50 family metallopeptidase n=1 Tax=Algicola sagamiensis TaxID=163869 RepID=UPI000376E8A1|nr:M50 family metallopeptidase [Algicola sagamiensis]
MSHQVKERLLLAGFTILLFIFWNTIFVYPLKLLTVFFHEASHALMTLFTGGKVLELVVDPMAGGHVISQGGNDFLVKSAGYLGSLAFGVAIYKLAAMTRYDKAIMTFLGFFLMAISLVYFGTVFTLIFSGLTSALMILVGIKGSESVNDLVLRLIGLSSAYYVPLDILSDTIFRSHLRSDARMLAETYGGTTILWGGAWFLISIFVVYKLIFSASMKQDKSEVLEER